MSTKLSPRVNAHASMPTAPIRFWATLVLIAAVVSALAVSAVLGGAAVQQGERLRAEQIHQENRMLCGKLGLSYGTERFAACAEVLSQARREEAKRVASEAAGIL